MCNAYEGTALYKRAIVGKRRIHRVSVRTSSSSAFHCTKVELNDTPRYVFTSFPSNYLSNADFFVEGDIQKIAEKIFEL